MQHISSRLALDTANTRLLQEAATLDDAGLGALGEGLASVAGLLTKEASLRRTLSEATTPIEARAGLMQRLLTGKVGDPVLRMVDFVVRQYWASGHDLRDGIERLGRTATFLRAERVGELDDVEDQIFRFGRIVDGAPELSVILDDPTVDGAARASLVDRLLAHRAHPLVVQLLMSIAQDPAGRSFTHGVHELVEQAAERRDKIVAEVEAALPLTVEEMNRLTAGLARVYGRQVAVHVVVNPSLAGGLRVRVGDEVIDGSVSGRLDELRRRMAS